MMQNNENLINIIKRTYYSIKITDCVHHVHYYTHCIIIGLNKIMFL